MKNISIITLLAITLICNSVYAETTKSAKKTKSTDTNQTISDEEFMKQWGQLEKEKKEVRAKTIETRLQLKKSSEELEKSKKLGEALDELLNKVEEIKKHEK